MTSTALKTRWEQLVMDGHESGPGYCNLACCNMAKTGIPVLARRIRQLVRNDNTLQL